ncbi:MAG TPA: ABC transporter permease [Gemmatimonas sp.]|nr:ABC transporter permease [Gemmatimonas sp.]
MQSPDLKPGVRRLFRLARRRPANASADDVDDEIRFHLEQRVAQLVAGGLDPDRARQEAERRFGDLTEARAGLRDSARHRDRWLEVRESLASVWHDVRFAWRGLVRAPAFTTVAVVCLALGVGANVAIFSIIDGVLLKPLPFGRPTELVSVWPDGAVPPGILDILSKEQRSYSSLGGYEEGRQLSLTGAGDPRRVQVSATSANFFETLGVAPALGRGFRRGDDIAGGERTIVLSHGFWQSHFGGDPAAVGRTVQLDGGTRRIIGVMPPSFRFPSSSIAMWAPVQAAAGTPDYWWSTYMRLVGRLATGATATTAQAEAAVLLPRARASFPMRMPDGWGRDVSVTSLHEAITGGSRQTLLLLVGAVGLVLLIACVNVATLYMARAAGRAREIAVRAALGGGRRRILRMLLTESTVLAATGAAAGLALAAVTTRVLVDALPAGTPRVDEIAIDWRVLSFTLVLTALSAAAFGVIPAWRATRRDLSTALRATGGAGGRAGRQRVASTLATVQVALAVMLVSAAGLLIKSTWKLQSVNLGFRTTGTLAATLPLPSFPDDTAGRARVYHDAVLSALRQAPGVERVALASALPFGDGIQNAAMAVEAHPTPAASAPPTPQLALVSEDYFTTLSIPLLRGRALSPQDRNGAPRVALIDDAAARALWPTEDAIGQRIKFVWNDEWFTVVGVVGSIRRDSLSSEPEPSVYLPLRQAPPRSMRLIVATSGGDASAMAERIRAVVQGVDGTVPMDDIRPLADVVESSASRSRFVTLLLSLFAAVAVTLGGVGIYGVISAGVAQRAREIGVRMAIGATTQQVRRMVLLESLWISGLGAAAGLVGAMLSARWIQSQLFGVDGVDPAVLTVVALLLAVVAVLAAMAPAYRASRVDPLVAMRSD